jgi:hypothetical protein
VNVYGQGMNVHCEDCHFSGYFLGNSIVDASGHITLHRCTVQVCVCVGGGGAC